MLLLSLNLNPGLQRCQAFLAKFYPAIFNKIILKLKKIVKGESFVRPLRKREVRT